VADATKPSPLHHAAPSSGVEPELALFVDLGAISAW
jgi:hypothetical protein